MCIYIYIYLRKTEAQAIFLNPFTVCSSCKRKFAVCLFVDEETNGSLQRDLPINGINNVSFILPQSVVVHPESYLYICENLMAISNPELRFGELESYGRYNENQCSGSEGSVTFWVPSSKSFFFFSTSINTNTDNKTFLHTYLFTLFQRKYHQHISLFRFEHVIHVFVYVKNC